MNSERHLKNIIIEVITLIFIYQQAKKKKRK